MQGVRTCRLELSSPVARAAPLGEKMGSVGSSKRTWRRLKWRFAAAPTAGSSGLVSHQPVTKVCEAGGGNVPNHSPPGNACVTHSPWWPTVQHSKPPKTGFGPSMARKCSRQAGETLERKGNPLHSHCLHCTRGSAHDTLRRQGQSHNGEPCVCVVLPHAAPTPATLTAGDLVKGRGKGGLLAPECY